MADEFVAPSRKNAYVLAALAALAFLRAADQIKRWRELEFHGVSALIAGTLLLAGITLIWWRSSRPPHPTLTLSPPARPCAHCEYDLIGLPPTASCPECGTPAP